MAAFLPFQADSGKSVGLTNAVLMATGAPASNYGTLTLPPGVVQSVLITNPGTLTAFVRMSTEVVPVATSADIPILPATARLFTAPAMTGSLGIAAIPSATLAVATNIYFTPGEGGS